MELNRQQFNYPGFSRESERERARKAKEIKEKRIRKLAEKLGRIKKQACGNGEKNCILCNDQPRFFSKFYTCKDCKNAVCIKCRKLSYELDTDEPIWSCKICSEFCMKKNNLWI